MVFVTGATGLLGSHIIYFLLRSGHDVCALKRRSSNLDEVRAVFEQYTSGELLWDKIKWVEGDVLDVGSMEEVVGQVDYVYHCAAVVSFSVCRKEELLAVNFTGTKNIASLCLKNKVRLCYVSSIGALGDVENEKDFIDEETPVLENREHSVYSQSKLLSESVVWDFIRKGLNAVIVNPSILLGSGHWNRSSSRLFTMASKGIWVYTGGVVGYVDVRDVCELMIRLTEDQRVMGERFIVSGGNYSYQELFSCTIPISC